MSILDENISRSSDLDGGLKVTGEMKRNWFTTSKWAMFFAILGFIQIGLSVLMLGSFGSTLQMMSALSGENTMMAFFSMIAPYVTALTIITSAVFFFIHFYHYRFASFIQRSINFTDQTAFEKAWMNLRNNVRLFGIMICVMLGFYLLGFLAFVFMGGVAAMGM
ncbi:MAG: hypothetical protein H6576_17225 [Lewinellaceae bacterium]|nr:hypothetical protein [Saprospiraceae bacterium]MCB9345433.1 hypothetical protein [Lewinellaceae bacterium]